MRARRSACPTARRRPSTSARDTPSDSRSSLGLVRLRVKKASEELNKIFESLLKKVQEPGADTPFGEITDEDIERVMKTRRERPLFIIDIAVPRDVAVVGYLNHYLCDHVDPPLTSVDLQHRVAARTMVRVLEDAAAAKGRARATELPRGRHSMTIRPMLVVRESA